MDVNLTIAITAACTLTFVYVITQEITRYKLKKVQIEADARVKAEEINAKNRLELEKLVTGTKYENISNSGNSGTDYANDRSSYSDDNRKVREKA